MKISGQVSASLFTCSIALVTIGLTPTKAESFTLVKDSNGFVKEILGLEVQDQTYDVDFIFTSFVNIFGDPSSSNFIPPTFWKDDAGASSAALAITEALGTTEKTVTGRLTDGTTFPVDNFLVPFDINASRGDGLSRIDVDADSPHLNVSGPDRVGIWTKFTPSTTATPSTTVTPVDWTTITSGTIANINVTTTGFSFPSPTSPSVENYSFIGSNFSTAPLSNVDTIYNYLSTDDWTATFDSPLSDLLIYGYSWRGTTSVHNVDPPTSYTFNLPFTILSGFNGAIVNGNTLTLPDNGYFYEGILEFSGSITTLSVVSDSEGPGAGQLLTFATTTVPATDVPEPSAVLGIGAVSGLGIWLQKRRSRKSDC